MSCDSGIITSQGTQLFISDGTNWNVIGGVTGLNPLDLTKDFVEVTSINSVDNYKEYQPTFSEPGSLNLSMNYTNTILHLFKSEYDANKVSHYKIVLQDTQEFTFYAAVSKLPLTVNVGEVVSMNVVLKLTGKVEVPAIP